MKQTELGSRLVLAYTAVTLSLAACAPPPPSNSLTARDRIQTQIALANGTGTPPNDNTTRAIPEVSIPPEVATQAAYVPTRVAEMRQELSQISFPDITPVPPAEATPSTSNSARDRLATQVAISQGTVSPASTTEAQITTAPPTKPTLNQCRMLRPIAPETWLTGRQISTYRPFPQEVHQVLIQTAVAMQQMNKDNTFLPSQYFTEADFLRIRQNLLNYRLSFTTIDGNITSGGTGYIIRGDDQTLTILTHGHTNLVPPSHVYPSDPAQYTGMSFREQINQSEYGVQVKSAQVFEDPTYGLFGSIVVLTINNPDPQRFTNAQACALPMVANYEPTPGELSLVAGFGGSFNFQQDGTLQTPYSMIDGQLAMSAEPHPNCTDNMYNSFIANTVQGHSGSPRFIKNRDGQMFIADVLQVGTTRYETNGTTIHLSCGRRIPQEAR